jgi:glycosyltransferase involved in cell wall biosynthesis
MRVLLLCSREDLEVIGGKKVQVEQTRAALQDAGIEVALASKVPEAPSFDLAHVFRSEGCGSTLAQCLDCVEARLPILLSPIWWDYRELLQYQNRVLGRPEDAADTNPEVRAYVAMWKAVEKELSVCCAVSNLVVANSRAEASLISEITGIASSKIHQVPNSVERAFAEASPGDFVSQYGLKDFILCAARIEDLKNQLSLIEAARDLSLDLVLIGEEPQPWYSSLCRAAASPRVHFLPSMDRHRLASAYAAAKVHALVSWYETTGLASLEAALARCRIVSTNRGAPPEYLGEGAWYCDPADVSSIRAALESAFAASPTDSLRERILSEYSQEKTAQALRHAYEGAASAGLPEQPSASSLAVLAESWHGLEAAHRRAAEYARVLFREREDELIAHAGQLQEWLDQRDSTIETLHTRLLDMQNLKVFRYYDSFSRSWLYRVYSLLARRKWPR